MATGAALVVVPGLVATPILGILGFGAGGIAAGSAAAGIQSGIGSVAAGSAGLAVVNGIVQVSGAVVVGAGGLAAKLKGKLKGQGDEHSANGDQEETDGIHKGDDTEEMVS
ncbi:hypothetical protein FVEG_05371 [Fusarium verticillioides 7600]|uniref:Uncharacterized protein n=1 Tax=Gibberella moniliformis (strain M3125 / FGSC 7600) TaxID=334819 RepID=W7LY65_GIBM7|nr:hypothetical protein FVEG_05371 [Fusarium verticillioides 7600]EWG44243.1 hypothetical protein FVEG_05371 [Fusarium verticillioides 7600]